MINRFKRRIRNFLSFGSRRKEDIRTAETSGQTEKEAEFLVNSHLRKKRDKSSNQKSKRNLHSLRPARKTGKTSKNIRIPKMPPLKTVEKEEGKARFSDFDISREILCAIQDLDFKYCTPVQEKCLPEALKGRDITAKAQTGTGKTAAFLIAAFTRLLKNPLSERKHGACRVLILAPTRELALQIYKDSEAISKYCGFNNLVVFGGMERRKQREKLADNIEILIGTPGRIIDFCRSRHLHLHDTEILVIDEADRMLDMGFIPDVRKIVSKLPEAGKRQTMFFSATLTNEITRLVDRWLVDPVTIEAEAEKIVTDLIEQKFYTVSREEKLAMLLWLIKNSPIERMLVFGNRKDTTAILVNKLRRYGIRCEILSGDVPQKKRLRILELFRKGDIRVLIATDVAARGIHVEGVSHVINYDLPEKPEDYIHRIGRTGRAGAAGESISFVCEYGAYCLGNIEKLLGYEVNCIYPDEQMVVMPSRTKNKLDAFSV